MVENHYVKSVSEFISISWEIIKSLETERVVWHRGEEDEEYNLVPNLYRKMSNEYCQDIINTGDFYSIEQNIDVSFNRKASVFLSGRRIENTPWNRYFLKQHYGVRTRLLDWTENALFALFFAVNNGKSGENNGKGKKNGRVSILSPHKLNNYSVRKLLQKDNTFYHILTASGEIEKEGELFNGIEELRIEELLRKYYRLDCKDEQKMYPLAIYPPHLDERMAAQQACFTLFGNIAKGLNYNDTTEKFIDYVYINADSKTQILKELRMLGISGYSIYPDLDGLGRTINSDELNDLNKAQENNHFQSFLNQNTKK